MVFPGASCPLLCGSVGIGSIVLLLETMPSAELVLIFNDDLDGHRINPTTPDPTPPMLLPS